MIFHYKLSKKSSFLKTNEKQKESKPLVRSFPDVWTQIRFFFFIKELQQHLETRQNKVDHCGGSRFQEKQLLKQTDLYWKHCKTLSFCIIHVLFQHSGPHDPYVISLMPESLPGVHSHCVCLRDIRSSDMKQHCSHVAKERRTTL